MVAPSRSGMDSYGQGRTIRRFGVSPSIALPCKLLALDKPRHSSSLVIPDR
jgi:hypothetical protein